MTTAHPHIHELERSGSRLHVSIKVAPYPEERVKVPRTFFDDLEDCFTNGKTEELEWAKIVAEKMQTETSDSSIAWTNHRSKQCRGKINTRFL